MALIKFLTIYFFLVGSCSGLFGQPSLTALWARHDQFVLDPSPRAPMAEPPQAFVFKGKHGQRVQGWDMGTRGAPVLITWQGGPGSAFDPTGEASVQPGMKAYRRLEIDQPGTGGSEWVPNWRPEDMVDDAVTFLHLRGINDPVIVSGVSWGSTMALLFAQRHPDLVRGVAVGGVWANSAKEVRRYLDGDGTRAWMPGLAEALGTFGKGQHLATRWHDAIRNGRGGQPLAIAYGEAEEAQINEGTIPRKPVGLPLADRPGKPVDMATETNVAVRFAYIESEMMARGQRQAWRLKMKFPQQLRKVPLLVIQGRYDQVCDPETAQKVVQAWPGTNKLLIPVNGGHGAFGGPTHDELLQAGEDVLFDTVLGIRLPVSPLTFISV